MARPLPPPRLLLALAAGTLPWAARGTGAASAGAGCDLDSLGFGERPLGLSEAAGAVERCGAAKLSAVYDPSDIADLLQAWLRFLETGEDWSYDCGKLRGHRRQTYLPFRPPFDSFGYLGLGSRLHPVLQRVIGDTYYLDHAPLVVTEYLDGDHQELHRDTTDEGIFSLHVPLEPINRTFGPLRFCPSLTDPSPCAEPYYGAPLAVGDAILYNNRIYHSGTANEYDKSRYVVYVTMLRNASQEPINEEPDDDEETNVSHIFESFQQKFSRLQHVPAPTTEL